MLVTGQKRKALGKHKRVQSYSESSLKGALRLRLFELCLPLGITVRLTWEDFAGAGELSLEIPKAAPSLRRARMR